MEGIPSDALSYKQSEVAETITAAAGVMEAGAAAGVMEAGAPKPPLNDGKHQLNEVASCSVPLLDLLRT